MDISTGKTYSTEEEAKADGVPESDIAHVTPGKEEIVQFKSGPFKNRVYRRDAKTRQLVRIR